MNQKKVAGKLVMVMMAAFMLTGCGAKSIDKMTDQELYNYMNENFASEDALDSWFETLTSEQQERAMVVSFTYGLAEYASSDKTTSVDDAGGFDSIGLLDADYEKSELWDSIDASVPAIQIWDIVLWVGMSREELQSQVDASQMYWKNINPDADRYATSGYGLSDTGDHFLCWLSEENSESVAYYDITFDNLITFWIYPHIADYIVYSQNVEFNGNVYVPVVTIE